MGVYISLHKWSGGSSEMQFVGMGEYISLFRSPRFWNAMKINWLVAIISFVMQIPLALGLALLMSKKSPLMTVSRALIFIPQALSIAAVAVTWTMLLHPKEGPINLVLGKLMVMLGSDITTVAWLGNTKTALLSVLVASTWYYFGFNMILFMAGLASIPAEYYDAVQLETNHWFDILRYVTLPLIREVLLITFVLNISGSFGHLIGLFYLLTQGGPANRTELLGIYMHNSAFVGSRYGFASAISVVMILIVLAVVLWPALHIARERWEF